MDDRTARRPRAAPREGPHGRAARETASTSPVTGRRQGGYAEVVVGGSARWVTAEYLSKKKVVDPADRRPQQRSVPRRLGRSRAACSAPSVKVYRAVCAASRELTAYGGQDGHGEHVNGEAIDFMVLRAHRSASSVKDFLYAHRAELDLFDIIWSQHIWTIQRSGEGFRSMSDRGSATANHYDHVHIQDQLTDLAHEAEPFFSAVDGSRPRAVVRQAAVCASRPNRNIVDLARLAADHGGVVARGAGSWSGRRRRSRSGPPQSRRGRRPGVPAPCRRGRARTRSALLDGR